MIRNKQLTSFVAKYIEGTNSAAWIKEQLTLCQFISSVSCYRATCVRQIHNNILTQYIVLNLHSFCFLLVNINSDTLYLYFNE